MTRAAEAADAPSPSHGRGQPARSTGAQGGPLLRVRELSRSFGKGSGAMSALREVSFEVTHGEVLLIFGPSGCGKSTLLSILGGLDRGYRGQLELFGERIEQLSDRALSRLRGRRIGFVFQAFHLLGHLSVVDNVAAPALFSGDPDLTQSAAERALAMLELVGLKERARALPAELSGGQRQRVALARALLREPELLLCDEPTGNLDSTTGEQIIDLFGDLHSRLGTTFVIVTHEARLRRIASRVLHLLDGRVDHEERLAPPGASGEAAT